MRPRLAYTSIADYLACEAKGPRKHEYVDGEIHVLAGASRRHNLLARNLHLRANEAAGDIEGCQVFGPNMKLYVEARNSFYYPDLSVCFVGREDRAKTFLTRPCLIVEILSPATASIDRREKRANYETLSSLCEYMIVEQDRMRVDIYRRQAGLWLVQVFTQPGEVFEVASLNLRLSLAELYMGVELPTGVAEPEPPEYGD